MKHLIPSLIVVTLAVTSSAPAAILLFDLQGKAGAGLLAGNENSVVTGAFGSGGESGAGITYDDASNILTLNFAWGSGNGFTNLTGNATIGHIHGPTVSSGAASFNENAGVMIGLDGLAGWNNSASAGGFSNSVTLTAGQETNLLAGQLYLNVHTSTNGGGEIRGNLVAVPEVSSAMISILGLGILAGRRRR